MEAGELKHYGVKGMRWGRRKRNPNYSDTQVKRDKQIYGAGGARRINKNLNKGDQISTARGAEKTRRDRVMGRNKYARQAGKVGGTIVGAGVGLLGIRSVAKFSNTRSGQAILSMVIGAKGANLASTILNSPMTTIAASAGAAKVGEMMSGDIGVGINMRLAGYDPTRK